MMLKTPENNKQSLEDKAKGTPPEIKLPFEKTKSEPGEWVFEHRIAICITVIIYLVLAISLIFSKIVIDRYTVRNEIIFDIDDLKTFEELQKELERAEELNKLLADNSYEEFNDVRNLVSNENAVVEELSRSDQEVQDLLRESREIFEQGNEEIRLLEEKKQDEDDNLPKDRKIEGSVAVSFSFSNPMRSAANLFVPAYKCEAGGVVVVNVAINPKGEVLSASVNKQASSSDYCMTSTAVDAAYRSRFHVHPAAPSKQNGTITYRFVPQ